MRFGDVDHDHPLGHVDLYRGKADAWCRVHGLEHVIDQTADGVIDLLDRFRGSTQARIWKGKNIE